MSAPKWGVTTNIKAVSANLSAQANRLVKGKTGPALGEEGIHRVLGEILGEHGELRHVQFRISGPPVVVFRQPPKIILADGLLR
jgi:hypothetical protein